MPGESTGKKETSEEWIARTHKELFKRFDDGIIVRRNMLNRVTKEDTARRISERVRELMPENVDMVIDGCGGSGGNSIQFALADYNVLYLEADPQTCEDALNNATVYGVADKIDFRWHDMMTFDYIHEVTNPKNVILHVSPDWGGRRYKSHDMFDLTQTEPSVPDLIELYKTNGFAGMVLWLPRNADRNQLIEWQCERAEYMYRDNWCDGVCAYWLSTE